MYKEIIDQFGIDGLVDFVGEDETNRYLEEEYGTTLDELQRNDAQEEAWQEWLEHTGYYLTEAYYLEQEANRSRDLRRTYYA